MTRLVINLLYQIYIFMIFFQDQYSQWFVSKIIITTKDGTRVKIVKPSTSIVFRPKRQDGELDQLSRFQVTIYIL
jgi:hypothetical protein